MADRPDPIMNRRRFFHVGLRRLLNRVAEAAEPLERAARKLSELEGPGRPPQTPIRPDSTLPLDQRHIE